jgi:hypothetical protein
MGSTRRKIGVVLLLLLLLLLTLTRRQRRWLLLLAQSYSNLLLLLLLTRLLRSLGMFLASSRLGGAGFGDCAGVRPRSGS